MSADEDKVIPFDTLSNLPDGEYVDVVTGGLTLCVCRVYAWCKKDERGNWVKIGEDFSSFRPDPRGCGPQWESVKMNKKLLDDVEVGDE